MKSKLLLPALLLLLLSCKTETKTATTAKPTATAAKPFIWAGANVYFLLTDRFFNGDTSNDVNFGRDEETAKLRGFEGGDLKGITQKIEEGYFDDLGINAIWFTPVLEQIHGGIDEGTGKTYGYHGYWAKDWTALDPNFGTPRDLEQLVKTAHAHGIRIVMDVVLNHTGPVTAEDPFWGKNWARQEPPCTYKGYDSTVECTLVANLPDIKTESGEEVELPPFLMEKWKKEGRYEQEVKELNNFFALSERKKTPQNYLIKWLTDYVRELGIDAFRVDTAKHVNEDTWILLKIEADKAFASWKEKYPEQVLDTNSFFMLGEVYGYTIESGREYDFGDKKVDYFAHGFDDLINFQFKYDAAGDHESMFAKYDSILHTSLSGKSVLNYATSHDDGQPFDKERTKPYETATKLLMTPGLSQIYYGDESARDLTIPGTEGDATLRSPMNWNAMDSTATKEILSHWQKLGKFRRDHPAVGAGKHKMISATPYIFSRTYKKGDLTDAVVLGLDLPSGEKVLYIDNIFPDGTKLRDAYSGKTATVKDGKVSITSEDSLVLLEKVAD